MGAVVSGLRVEVSNTLWKGTQHCGFLPRRTCQDSKLQTTYISRQTQKGNSLIPSKADKNKQRPYKKWIDFISNKNTKHVSYVVHLFCLHLPPCHPSYLLTAPSKPHSKVTVHSDVTLCSRRISCRLRCRGGTNGSRKAENKGSRKAFANRRLAPFVSFCRFRFAVHSHFNLQSCCRWSSFISWDSTDMYWRRCDLKDSPETNLQHLVPLFDYHPALRPTLMAASARFPVGPFFCSGLKRDTSQFRQHLGSTSSIGQKLQYSEHRIHLFNYRQI